MAAVLDPGAQSEPNLTTYPRAGTTKAFAQGYALGIKATDPVVTPDGTSYKFTNWVSSTGGGIANVNAAQTTLTVPATAITATAHYILAAGNPSPVDGATEVAVTTALDWSPASPSKPMDLYFGTSPATMTFKKHFNDGTTHGATNGEIGGPLTDTIWYYWRVDTDGAPGAVWTFKTESWRPENPTPADGATNIERNRPPLNWETGWPDATAWDVYFGTSPASLTLLATRTAPDVNDVNAPNDLTINTTYYWRVNEYNSKGSPLTGFVWSFTTRGPLCLNIPTGDLDGNCRVTFVDFALTTKSWLNP
jgi:hypothetical protein